MRQMWGRRFRLPSFGLGCGDRLNDSISCDRPGTSSTWGPLPYGRGSDQRWYEKAGLQRDALSSQYALEVQKETGHEED